MSGSGFGVFFPERSVSEAEVAAELRQAADRLDPPVTSDDNEAECGDDALDTVTRRLAAAGFVGCDLPDDDCECECTCEIDIEGLGAAMGKEVAVYFMALRTGGFTQDEAQYLAGDLHSRLWDIALGDA